MKSLGFMGFFLIRDVTKIDEVEISDINWQSIGMLWLNIFSTH